MDFEAEEKVRTGVIQKEKHYGYTPMPKPGCARLEVEGYFRGAVPILWQRD